MQMQPVKSSQISAIGHEGTTLRVQFKNGVSYAYRNVTLDQFNTLLSAPSVGSHFSSTIKPYPAKFPFQKII